MTMDIAQKLYENGKVNLYESDSTYIAPEFKQLFKHTLQTTYGSTYYRNQKQSLMNVILRAL